MLKTGIESVAYFRYGENEVVGLAKAKAHGYDCLDYADLAGAGSPLFKLSATEFERYLTWLKAKADENGIWFNQAHGLWFMDDKDEAERKSNIEYYKKEIEGCAYLGCPNLVIHTCLPGGWNGGRAGETQMVFDENVKVIEAILPTAKEFGVTICVENLPFKGFSLSPARAVKELVRFIDDKNVKICLDTGHAHDLNEKPYETVKLLGDDLVCMHVHDNTSGDRHYIPYQGAIDWDGFTRALGEIGYQGVMSLETVISDKMPEPMREGMQRSLAQIARYLAEKVGE